jgi:hypothetical protein
MKTFINLLTAVIFVSCGADPLFSSIESSRDKVLNQIQSFEDSGFRVWPGDTRMKYAISWKESPSFGNKSSFEIKFWDYYQNDFFGPYEKLNNPLCVFLWMKMPDGNEHGSSPVTLIEREDSYFVDDIYFIMSGQWEVRVREVEKISDCTSLKQSPYIVEDVLKIDVL